MGRKQFIQDNGTICAIIMPKGKIDNANLVKFEYLLPDNTSYSAAINDSGKNRNRLINERDVVIGTWISNRKIVESKTLVNSVK